MVKLTESIVVFSVHHLKNFFNDIITRLRTKTFHPLKFI